MFLTLPFSSSIFAFVATPTNVPIVSNISINNNVNNTITISNEKILCHSNFINVELIDGGILTIELGNSITPIGIPIIVVMIIPKNNAPLTFLATNIPVITIPINDKRIVLFLTSPNASIVAPSPITTPAASSPNRAINKPIPIEIAFFILTGIESTIASRTLNNVNNIKIKPSNKTAVSANSNEYPICNTTVYAKKAFNPMPGA